MRWLSESCVLLRCDELINNNYRLHQVTPGQFCVPKPYQAPELVQAHTSVHTAVSVASTNLPVADHKRTHVPPCSSPVPPEPLPVDSSTRPLKRRRQGQSDSQAEIRQGEAQQRHDACTPNLLSAYQLIQQFLQTANTTKAALQHTVTSSLQCHPAEDSSMQKTETLDLLALHELKYNLHPKFSFVHDDGTREAPVNLFDNLICNDGDQERGGDAFGHTVVIPAQATFLLSDIKKLSPLLTAAECQLGFYCIVLDPPWENKSAKRGSKYPTLPSRNLKGIALQKLMHADGCLVALWVTNRERHHRFIREELLPHWGLKQVATWFWLKVTDSGELVSPLEVAHRRPYEVLMLLQPLGMSPHQPLSPAASTATNKAPPVTPADLSRHTNSDGAQPAFHAIAQPPDGLVMVAVPGEHSRKPQLAQLLQPYLPEKASCLEMFARELTAGWTSWGNQVLHFQQGMFLEPLQLGSQSSVLPMYSSVMRDAVGERISSLCSK
ncbi:hypothetical protein ABBQ32_010569 [Trebouxia sp. C0010 RCD-2024]